jgi:hypothetical protein
MRQYGVYRTIESLPIGLALLNYLDSHPEGWSGKLIELLGLLSIYRPSGETYWPKSAKSMGDVLRRLTPALRTLGFNCKSNQKTSGSIIWEINPIPMKESNQCPTSPSSPETFNVAAETDLGHAVHEGHGNDTLEGVNDEEQYPF